MLKAILRAVAAVESLTVSANVRVKYAALRAQGQLLKAASSLVNDSIPKRTPKLKDGLAQDEITQASREGGKISAIKLYRERTGVGLKEAKDAVENWMEKNLGFRHYPVSNTSRIMLSKNGLFLQYVSVNQDKTIPYAEISNLPYAVQIALEHFARGELQSWKNVDKDNYNWCWA